MNVSVTTVDISKAGEQLSRAFREQELQRKEQLLKGKLYRKKQERMRLENEIPILEREHIAILFVMNREGITVRS